MSTTHYIECKILHKLDNELVNKIVSNVQDSKPEHFSIVYDCYSKDSYIVLPEERKRFQKGAFKIDSSWMVGEFSISMEICVSRESESVSNIWFELVKPTLWDQDPDGWCRDYGWYLRKIFEIIGLYEIANLYVMYDLVEPSGLLSGWGIKAVVPGLTWGLKVLSDADYDIKIVKSKLKIIEQFLDNGDKLGCKFKPYNLSFELRKEPYLIFEGVFLDKAIFFKVGKFFINVHLAPGESAPRDIGPYVKLFVSMCDGFPIDDIRADSMFLGDIFKCLRDKDV